MTAFNVLYLQSGDNSGNKLIINSAGQIGISNFPIGQQLAAASVPVVLTAAQLTALTPLSTVTVNQGTSPWIISGSFSPTGTQDVNLKQVGGTTFALGQQLSSGSLPIVLTAAQIATLTPPAAITNYALETGGNLATLAGGVSSAKYQTNVAQVGGATYTLGQQLASASAPVVLTAAQIATLTPPTTVTVQQATAANLNATARIQDSAGSAITLGQQLAAASLPIVLTAAQLSALVPLTSVSVTQGTSPWVISGSLTPAGTQDVNLKQVGGSTFALGQQLSTASLPVVLTAAQITSLTNQNIAQFGGTNVSLGQKVSASSIPVVVSSDYNLPTISAQSARTTGTITTNTSVVSVSVSQYSVATITVSGTYAGVTINFEASDDGGTTWFAVLASDSTSASSASTSVALASNATKMYNVTLPGVTNFRVRASAYTSGTANIGITATADSMVFNVAVGVTNTVTVGGPNTSGTAATGTPVRVGAKYNATQPTFADGNVTDLQSTARGGLIVSTGADNFNVNLTQVGSSSFSLGQQLAAASLPVVLTAAQITSLTPPTQVKTLSSQNEVTFTTTTAQAVGTTDCGGAGYQSVSVQFTSTGGSSTTTFQCSNDNVTWYSVPLMLSSSIQSVAQVTSTTNNLFYGNIPGRYFRLNVAGIVSGTTAGVIEFYDKPINLTTIGANAIVVGSVASGGTDSGSPVKIGYIATTSEITAVTNAQRVNGVADTVGRQIVFPYSTRDNIVKGSASATGTSDTSVVASAGGSLKNYITGISIANTGATTALITIKDGSGGATLWQTIAPAGGGSNITFPSPIAGTAATAVYFAAGSASTTIYCSIVGFKGV